MISRQRYAALGVLAATTLAGGVFVAFRDSSPPMIEASDPAAMTTTPSGMPENVFVMPSDGSAAPPTTAPFQTRFELAAGVAVPPGDAAAYRWPTPSQRTAEALAAQLGIAGPVTEAPASNGGGWTADGLLVLPNGNWSMKTLAPAGPTCGVAAGCPITPVDGLPTDGAAKRTAAAFIAKIHPGASVVSVERDEMGVRVALGLAVADGTHEVQSTVTLGTNGAVTAATGTLGMPVKVGTYPTISLSNALERLQQNPEVRSVGDAAKTCSSAAPADCLPSSLTITKAYRTTKVFVHADGGLWIVPAYAMVDELGTVWLAEAVSDRYLNPTR